MAGMKHHLKRITPDGHQVTHCGLTTKYNINIKTAKHTRAVTCKRCRSFGAAYNTITRGKPDEARNIKHTTHNGVA